MVLTRSQRATGAQTFEVWKIYASYNGIAQFRSEPEEQKASVTSFRLFAKMANLSCSFVVSIHSESLLIVVVSLASGVRSGSRAFTG